MPPPKVGRAKKEPADLPDLTVIVDDVRYEVRLNRVTARDAVGLRHATGRSVNALLGELTEGGDPDIDVIAALVWLARRQAGEQVLSFDKVAEAITYESTFDFDDGTEPSEDDLGEAPAADTGG